MSEVQITKAEQVVLAAIEGLLAQRGGVAPAVRRESNLLDDLDVESLELAELSVTLSEELGRDPFTEGIFPETVAELLAFYGS